MSVHCTYHKSNLFLLILAIIKLAQPQAAAVSVLQLYKHQSVWTINSTLTIIKIIALLTIIMMCLEDLV